MKRSKRSADGPSDEEQRQKDLIRKFCERTRRLEARFKNDRFADKWLIPREEMIAVADHLEKPTLFDLGD